MKKHINLFIALSLSAALLSGCGKTQKNASTDTSALKEATTVTANNMTEKSTESVTTTESTVNKESSSKSTASDSSSFEYTSDDGSYYSTLLSKENGKPDSLGYGTTYDVSIDNNTLTICGSILYTDTSKTDKSTGKHPETLINNTTTYFTIDSNTVFETTGGDSDASTMTKNEFIKYLPQIKDSGLGLSITIKNGVVVTIAIAS